MRGTAARTVLGVGLLLGCCLAGCVTPGGSAPFKPDPPNPFVDGICKADLLVLKDKDGKDIKFDPPLVDPSPVVKEIPLGTPLADARAIMERHGFSCQGGVRDDNNYQTYLYCKAYRRKTAFVADRVGVKLFYENKRVDKVEVTVELGVKRSNALFPDF